MDFIEDITAEFRRNLWEFLARGPATADGLQEEAQRVHAELCKRDPDDLAKHVEAYLCLSAAGLLDQYDQDHRRTGVTRPQVRRHGASVFQLNASPHAARRLALQRMRQQVSRLTPECRAVLVLARQEQMGIPRIAEVLGMSVERVLENLKTALRTCAFGEAPPMRPTSDTHPFVVGNGDG